MCDSAEACIILASQSPRRRELLAQAGLGFTVIHSGFDEEAVALTEPTTYVQTLARGKAEEVSRRCPGNWILGADTIVVIDGTILGKPRSTNEARRMIRRLSGQTHQVYTGYAICSPRGVRTVTEVVRTDVTFKRLSGEEIEWYIHTPEPYDKAGGYAVQGLGGMMVREICGSYTNVVGLPVCEVMDFLIRERVVALTPSGMVVCREGDSAA